MRTASARSDSRRSDGSLAPDSCNRSVTTGRALLRESFRNQKTKHFLPKKSVEIFVHFRGQIHSFWVKNPNKSGRKIKPIFKTGHFASQNGPFCSPK